MTMEEYDEDSPQMRASALQSICLLQDIYRGRTRPLINLVVSTLKAYEGSTYALSDEKADALCLDLARTVASQSLPREKLERLLSSCARIISAHDDTETFDQFINRLGRDDLSRLRDACDIPMRIGMLQFDRLSHEIHVYPHMYSSGVLLENSLALHPGGPNPSIRNERVPEYAKKCYEAFEKIKQLYISKYIDSASTPGPGR